MTRKDLEQKIAATKAQKEQFISNANACEGAILAYTDILNSLPEDEVVDDKEDATENK
jgi:hypothetical protein